MDSMLLTSIISNYLNTNNMYIRHSNIDVCPKRKAKL